MLKYETAGGTARVRDDAGHLWPVTGLWCDRCGKPLAPAVTADGWSTHPNCAPGW